MSAHAQLLLDVFAAFDVLQLMSDDHEAWQIATRLTAAKYGVKLSPSFLVPSNWTGCLGVINNYESLL